jgi:hypothetical protein
MIKIKKGDLPNIESLHVYEKKGLTFAVRVGEPFLVETPTGTSEGRAGDFLALDRLGFPYPIAKEVMEVSYRRVCKCLFKEPVMLSTILSPKNSTSEKLTDHLVDESFPKDSNTT